MNASPNLTDPYDPMAGTMQGTGRITYSPDFQSEKPATARVMQANSPATPHETLIRAPGGGDRSTLQCQARGCDGCLICRPAGAAQVVQERHKTAGGAGAAPDSFARAADAAAYAFDGSDRATTGNTMAEVVASLDPNPWAEDATDPWARPELANLRNSSNSVSEEAPALNVNILALDLGTKTGYALRRRDGRIAHGTQDFTPRKSWSEGQKWARYRAWLIETIREGQVHQVVYELVIRHEVKGRPLWDAAHAYGAFQAITHMVCDSFNVDAIGVNLATVKKSFTGSGRAKKADMIAKANARGFRPESDNDADALAILHWAVAQERKA